MSDSARERVTSLINSLLGGDRGARSELLELVYTELLSMARAKLAGERPGGTIQTRDLVHDAYLRLVATGADGTRPRWENRRHFYGAAAEAMRRILIDSFRRRQTLKRGGDAQRVPLYKAEGPGAEQEDPFFLSEALEAFQLADARAASVVRLRYFAGLTIEETAKVLEIAPRTAKKDWTFAKAWLRNHLARNETKSS